MKVRRSLAAAALAGLCGAGPALAEDCAGKPGPTRLNVRVVGVRAAQGEVAVTLYPDVARRWLAPKGKLLRQRVSARAPATTACFYLPQPGTYAIAIYHDANGDQDFNRNLVGMPVEGYGFSNDAPTSIGLPAFESVRFRVNAGQSSMTIRMRY